MAYKGLPDYVVCPTEDCDNKHFLTFNRNIDGKWTAAYVEFEEYGAICAINNADTLDEAVIRLKASLKRTERHFNQ